MDLASAWCFCEGEGDNYDVNIFLGMTTCRIRFRGGNVEVSTTSLVS